MSCLEKCPVKLFTVGVSWTSSQPPVMDLIPRVIIPYFQEENSVEVRCASLHVFLCFIDVCLVEPASINELGIAESDLKQYHSE